MRPVLMMTAAVLLACVAYSHQQLVAMVADVSDEDGDGDVLSTGQQELSGGSLPSDGQQELQEANALRGGGKRPKPKKKPKKKPIISQNTLKHLGKRVYEDIALPVIQQQVLGQVASTLATALDELPDAVVTTTMNIVV
ncbi:uncharacterized protein LOC121733224 isoform X2 [Aricia agestis]|uniref:uncharacterized protein LOC121733224 isoform X2 n=1 Tax=Aricia agestis TaxID=91739 RepID=UPI001C20B682|nr:uncharacterized protein LOC121733224 isoform X2 [Aricia agestis]